jgi:spermidine synthase
VILACFFLSGATGLIYQVLWLRMLGLVFGHTVHAVTTVLAAFMAGLALGSFVLARRTRKVKNLIGVYGLLEIGIGVYCGLLPFLLDGTAWVYLGLHERLGLSYGTFNLVQFILVSALLVVPTSLMGGTLPVLSQAMVTPRTDLGRWVGTLYAVNTFGAVIGVMLAGYAILPMLGNRLTMALAALANLAVGGLALAWARSPSLARALGTASPAPSPGADAPVPATSAAPRPGVAERLTIVGLGVSGAVSMVFEVAWTRALALVIGSSTYAFTSMLVAFLLGIAGGSALYSWLWGRRRASPLTFGSIQVALGLTVAATVLVFDRIPELFLVVFRWSDSPVAVQVSQVVVSALTLLPSTLLIGATFPAAVAIAARAPERVGQDVGQVYSINTLGAIVGAVAAGFGLIPLLGLHGSLQAGIAVNLWLGAALFATAVWPRPGWRWGAAGAAAVVGAAVLFLPPWDYRVMSSGPAVYARTYVDVPGSRPLREILQAPRVLFYRDGVSSTVSVTQEGEHVLLRVNGKVDAGTATDMTTQLVSGHLPLLLQRDPRTVLVIGMGSGITAGAVARHPIERLDVVEIEPAVVEATRFFAHIHRGVLQDARVRVFIADGRNYLLTTPERYDVIISEPSNPWIGGLASLFSREFFEHARHRLRPDGSMLQWVQGYRMFPDDLRMVVNTFRAAFPNTTVWHTGGGDFLLLGTVAAHPIDLGEVQARYERSPGIAADLGSLGVQAGPAILGYAMLNERDAMGYSAGAGLNTDDRLPLEFSAPRALYVRTTGENLRLMQRSRTGELPDLTPESMKQLDRPLVRYWVGRAALTRRAPDDALAQFQRALDLDPGYVPAALGAASALLNLSRTGEALEAAQRVLATDAENAEALFLAGLAAGRLSRPEQSIAFLERAVARDPGNPEFRAVLDHARRRAR